MPVPAYGFHVSTEERMKRKRLLLMGLMLSLLMLRPPGVAATEESVEDEKTKKDKTETVQPETESEAEKSQVYMKIGEITVTE
jgi:hypothetical protein